MENSFVGKKKFVPSVGKGPKLFSYRFPEDLSVTGSVPGSDPFCLHLAAHPLSPPRPALSNGAAETP